MIKLFCYRSLNIKTESNQRTTSESYSIIYNNNGVLVAEISSDNADWHTVSEIGKYIPTSNLTRFFFVAGSTASQDKTIGNFVDNVGFSQELPEPEDQTANIEIEKVVTGLTSDEIKNYEVTVSIAGPETYTGQKSVKLSGFTGSDGTYTASTTLTNVPLGKYTISETLPSGYKSYNCNSSAKFNTAGTETTGNTSVTGTTTNKVTSTVTFTNAYEPSEVEVTIKKVITGSMGDKTKSFSFEVTPDSGTIKTSEGTAVEKATASLTNNGEMKVKVKAGTVLTISETNASGYTTTAKDSDDETLNVAGDKTSETKTIEYTVPSNGGTVTITNTKEGSPDTGIFTDSTPYIAMLGIVAVGTIALFMTHKHRHAE